MFPFVYRPGSHFFARSSCTRFGSEPDKRNASVRRGPGGFFIIYFSIILKYFLLISKNVFSLRLPPRISVFWVSSPLFRERSRKRRIPPCPRPFLFSYFSVFLQFLSAQKSTAPKWPRPGDEHFRDAVLARRHSRSAIFSGKKGGGKPSMRYFFSEKRRRR